MKRDFIRRAAGRIARRLLYNNARRRISIMLAMVVVFMTTYALVLPAITMGVDTAAETSGIALTRKAAEDEDEAQRKEAQEESDAGGAEETERGAGDTDGTARDAGSAGAEVSGGTGSAAKETSDEGGADGAGAKTSGSGADGTAESSALSEKDGAGTDGAVLGETAIAGAAEGTAPLNPEEALPTAADALSDPETAEALMPAQSFEAALAQVRIVAEAEEGAFPKGTQMKAAEVKKKEILDAIAEETDEDARVLAVDISFLNEDGEEIEPEKKISVRLISALIQESEEAKVVHVDDEGEVSVVEAARKGESDSELTFESDAFSVYAIVGTGTLKGDVITADGETYEVTVAYGPEAHIPEQSELSVREFAEGSDAYEAARAEVVAQKKAQDAEFDEASLGFAALDISITAPDGSTVEPEAAVEVTLRLKKFPKGTSAELLAESLEIQHLDESGGDVTVETVAEAGAVSVGRADAVAEFTLESFSTFALTWTNGIASVHWGTLENGSFTEFDASSLDTDAASINLRATYPGYEYVDAVYYTSEPDTVSITGTSGGGRTFINSVITKESTSGGYRWMAEDSHNDAETFEIANGGHIYAVYQEPGSGAHPTTPTGSGGDGIPTPTTEKSVTPNQNADGTNDGTYTVELAITGAQVTETTKTGANVLVVFDNSGSMSSYIGGITRLQAAKNAVATLVDALDPGTNDIDMALVYFASTATKRTFNGGYWTKSGSALTSAVNALSVNSGGTNWDQALQYAKEVADTGDGDPTYVIFLTDGCPSTNSHVAGHAHGIYGTTNIYDECYTWAVTNGTAIVDAGYYLYGIYAGSYDANMLNYLISDTGGVSSITATSASDITAAFNNVAQTIINNLGATGVSTNDGITSLASVSASVGGAAGAFEYYRRGGSYGTTPVVWTDAPGAIYSDEAGVTWDLSSVGPIEANVTYILRFTVWPSQAAYDLIADLNNGLRSYDELEEEIQSQIVQNADGTYSMKTNTNLDTTYTFKGTTYTDPVAYTNGTMGLDVEAMHIRKEWVADGLDSQDIPDTVTIGVTRDGEDYFSKTLTKAAHWVSDDIYISCGVMTVKDGVVTVKETGHDFSVTEPVFDEQHNWELSAEIYHPMVINGTATMLKRVESADDADYTIDGKFYQTLSGSEAGILTATNTKRSSLDFTKAVTTQGADMPDADALFTYRARLTVPAAILAAQPDEGYIFLQVQDADGNVVAPGDITTDAHAPSYYDPSYAGMDAQYLAIASGEEFTVSIKKGWNVRFENLFRGTTYEIEETADMPDGFAFDRAEVTDAADMSVDGRRVSGTIAVLNTLYKATWTNSWTTTDFTLQKADEGNAALAGAVFNLNKYNGSTFEAVAAGISAGTAELGRLGIGRYQLTEVKAPDGYVILTGSVYFEIYKTGDDTLGARLTDENGTAIASSDIAVITPGGSIGTGYTITVRNTPGQALPDTGGIGTLPYTSGGLTLIGLAALMYGFRMRRRRREVKNSL